MTTDTTEKGLESQIVADMLARGWIAGDSTEYHREYAVDLVQLREFLIATQKPIAELLDLDNDTPARRSFLARLQGEITKHGVIYILRNGIKHGAHSIELFYGTPSPDNIKAGERNAANRFSVT